MVVQAIGIVLDKLMIVPPLMLFDPSISASPLLPAGVEVWAIRDLHHIQISRVEGSVFMVGHQKLLYTKLHKVLLLGW